MRTIIYAVFNKETNERVYTNCKKSKCEEFAKSQGNSNLEVRYKWYSF